MFYINLFNPNNSEKTKAKLENIVIGYDEIDNAGTHFRLGVLMGSVALSSILIISSVSHLGVKRIELNQLEKKVIEVEKSINDFNQKKELYVKDKMEFERISSVLLKEKSCVDILKDITETLPYDITLNKIEKSSEIDEKKQNKILIQGTSHSMINISLFLEKLTKTSSIENVECRDVKKNQNNMYVFDIYATMGN